MRRDRDVWAPDTTQQMLAVAEHRRFHGAEIQAYRSKESSNRHYGVIQRIGGLAGSRDGQWTVVAIYVDEGDTWYCGDRQAPTIVTDQFEVKQVKQSNFERIWGWGLAATMVEVFKDVTETFAGL